MIQEFQDEVLDTSGQSDNNPRYRIRDNSGTILQDDVQISLKTPVTQEGTKLNKATFNNLQGDVYTADRYNTVRDIVPEQYNTIVDKTGNIFPDSILANWEEIDEKTHYIYQKEGATLNGTILTASNSYVAGGDLPIDVFGDRWVSNPTTESWIKVELPQPLKVKSMSARITCSNTSYFTKGYIEGSNDDTTWNILHTISTAQTSTTTMALSNPSAYKYYRIRVTINGNFSANVSYWKTTVYEGEETHTRYKGKINLPLKSYENFKIVNIDIPYIYKGVYSTDDFYLSINNLKFIKIYGTVCQDRRYLLIYQGNEQFIPHPLENIITGTYTGNGAATREIVLGFKPKAIIVSTVAGQFFTYNGASFYAGGLALDGYPAVYSGHTLLAITDKGFQVASFSGGSLYVDTNGASDIYKYIAIA